MSFLSSPTSRQRTHRLPDRELSEFLSAYYLRAKANSTIFFAQLSEFSLPKQYSRNSILRERKMRTNIFWHNNIFKHPPRVRDIVAKFPGHHQIPLFKTQGRQTFEGEHEVFGHHSFVWKTPTPMGGLWTQQVKLCVLFSYA